MKKINRIMIALVACGLMLTSARAAMVITENPLGLNLLGITGDGMPGWPYWDTDELEAAYDIGQLDVSVNGGLRSGTPEALVDGDANTLGLIMYSGWTATYDLKDTYTGPRDLGADGWGHALRIEIDFHENWNDYDLEVYYETTDAPGVFKTLFKVHDYASDPAWKGTLLYVQADAASAAVQNIDKIHIKSWEVTQSGGGVAGGGLNELNVSLVPEPATMGLIGITGLLALASRRFRI